MQIKTNSRAGVAGVAWLLLVFFVLFVIFILGVAYTVVRTFQKIVPPPPPDDDGVSHVPPVGGQYQGGVVKAYVPPPHETTFDPPPAGFTVHWVYIFADNSPRPPAWTNCIWNGDLANVQEAMGTNGLPLELWPDGQVPSQRFYNIVVSNSFGQ